MIGRWYPNLELAQAKSSLKYRVTATRTDPLADRPPSPAAVSFYESPPKSPYKRQHHVPSLDGHSDTRQPVESPPKSTIGRRRRRVERSPSPDPHAIVLHRTGSLTLAGPSPSRDSRTASGSVTRHGVDGETNTVDAVPVSLSRKLEAINHIIARADLQPPTSPTVAAPANDSRWKTVHSEHGEMLFDSTEAPQVQSRRGSNRLEPLKDGGMVATTNASTASQRSPGTNRKVAFLLKQQPSPDRPKTVAGSNDDPASPSRRRAAASSRQQSSKYLITGGPPIHSAVAVAPTPLERQPSQRQLNDARVMEFVDDVNMKPRTSTATATLDKQLRRISLVSFEQRGSESKLLHRNDSSLALRRKQMFGLYSIREVMAVIRLFWFLDADGSGDITLDELHRHRQFFVQLGRTDLGAVFRELDVDGNGTVALNELLRVCFRAANDQQLQAMLTLAKVGNVREYLTRGHPDHSDDAASVSTTSLDHTRAEFQEIFRIFDRNGDGHINRVELLEALQIDDDLLSPALETSRDQWGDNARRIERAKAGGLTKEDVERFYSEYDQNNDDVLDFDEFLKLMAAAASH